MAEIQKYEQDLAGKGKIVVLITDDNSEYTYEIMSMAVSNVVLHELHNEMIDVSMRRPFLRLIYIGDINNIGWKPYPNEDDCEYVEFDLKNIVGKWIGKVAFLRGGLYNQNPSLYMSNMVQKYLDNLDGKGSKYTSYNEMCEIFLDNPWFRVILLNLDKLNFEVL